MKADPATPATHYRLSKETWAKVVEEYLDGASARDVAAKWKTSAGSVYRWSRELYPGGGKRAVGDARARAHARVVEEEEAAVRALNPVGSRALKGLFSPAPQDRPEASNPVELARLATLASGRAMTGRLWNEAKALAGLAETYSRLAERGAKRDAEQGDALDYEQRLDLERGIAHLEGVYRGYERALAGRPPPHILTKQADPPAFPTRPNWPPDIPEGPATDAQEAVPVQPRAPADPAPARRLAEVERWAESLEMRRQTLSRQVEEANVDAV